MHKFLEDFILLVSGCVILMVVLLVALPSEDLTSHYALIGVMGSLGLVYFGYKRFKEDEENV